jgi:hypothetical protein
MQLAPNLYWHGTALMVARAALGKSAVVPKDGMLRAALPGELIAAELNRSSGRMPAVMRPFVDAASRVVFVTELPTCDICGHREGRYEMKMRSGRWAMYCPWCVHRHTSAQLGLGAGQQLITYDELPEQIRADLSAMSALVRSSDNP